MPLPMTLGTGRALLARPLPVTYLWRPMPHPQDQASPLASPYSEPGGVGTMTLVQADGQFSTAGGKLVYPVQATPASGDQGYYSPIGFSRLPGRALLCEWTPNATNKDTMPLIWSDSNSSVNFGGYAHVQAGFYAPASGTLSMVRNSGAVVGVAPFSALVAYQLMVVLRTDGAHFFIKGGAFAIRTRLYVAASGNTATLYPALENYSGSGTLFDPRVTDLGAPWNTDQADATSYAASAAANDTATMTADAVVEGTWTAVTGQTWNLMVRRIDDSNCLLLRGDQAGSTVKLIKVDVGVETELDSKAQTWTNATAYRAVVICDGTALKTYVNDVAKASVTNSYNVAATGAKTDRALTGFICWPRYPTLPNV